LYAKESDGKGHNFAGVGFKAFDNKLGIGFKGYWINDTPIPNGNGTNGNTDLLKASLYQGNFIWQLYAGPKWKIGTDFKEGIGDISMPNVKVKAVETNKEDSCTSCLELGLAVKAILGIELKITFGFR
jgi:hypothetical protein